MKFLVGVRVIGDRGTFSRGRFSSSRSYYLAIVASSLGVYTYSRALLIKVFYYSSI